MPQVDARVAHGGGACGHIGLGLLLRGHGVGVVLLAHGLCLHQRLVATGQRTGLRQVGLGTRQLRLGALQRGLVGCGVNAEQHLPSLHVAAFLKEPLLQDARGARPDLRHARGLQAARQFGLQAHVAGLHGQHAHFGRRHLACAAALRGLAAVPLAAGRKGQGQGQHAQAWRRGCAQGAQPPSGWH